MQGSESFDDGIICEIIEGSCNTGSVIVGTFRVEMKRHPQKERTIMCQYNPTEIGEYSINVQWSGEHIPGSPFRVILVDTIEEFRKLQSGVSTNPFGKSKYGTMTSDMNDGFMFMDG